MSVFFFAQTREKRCKFKFKATFTAAIRRMNSARQDCIFRGFYRKKGNNNQIELFKKIYWT